ncbi:MAG: MBL fold metallo-hydrolase, partial [Proteobacteria bacterium]
MSLNVKYWGVRGSLPSSPSPAAWTHHIEGLLRGFVNSGLRDASQITPYLTSLGTSHLGGFGAATTSVEVISPKNRIIIDGGSGIRALSDQIMSGTAGSGKGPFHIFMTHFHWDHVIGLPFFTPHFLPGVQIHYYA